MSGKTFFGKGSALQDLQDEQNSLSRRISELELAKCELRGEILQLRQENYFLPIEDLELVRDASAVAVIAARARIDELQIIDERLSREIRIHQATLKRLEDALSETRDKKKGLLARQNSLTQELCREPLSFVSRTPDSSRMLALGLVSFASAYYRMSGKKLIPNPDSPTSFQVVTLRYLELREQIQAIAAMIDQCDEQLFTLTDEKQATEMLLESYKMDFAKAHLEKCTKDLEKAQAEYEACERFERLMKAKQETFDSLTSKQCELRMRSRGIEKEIEKCTQSANTGCSSGMLITSQA